MFNFMKKKTSRFEKMGEKLPSLTDKELREWYSAADTHRIIGDACDRELDLLDKIETELCNRGYTYITNF